MFLDQTNRNFDALADKAATQFFSKGTTLSDSIVKIASEEKLNPMEIQRLVEKSNTSATLKLLKVSTDKKAEFKVANYADVISEIYPEKSTKSPAAKAGTEDKDAEDKDPEESKEDIKDDDQEGTPSEKTASDLSTYVGSIPMSLPNTRRTPLIGMVLPSVPMLKTASTKEVPLSTRIFKLSKDIEETVQEKLACEMKIQNRAEHVITTFSSFTAPSFSKFANEVHTIYGEVAHPLLNGISATLQEKPELIKVASLIDDTAKQHVLFKEAQESLHSLVGLQESVTSKKLELANLYEWANSHVNN